MKKVSIISQNHPYFTLISQLLKAASKPSKTEKIWKGRQ